MIGLNSGLIGELRSTSIRPSNPGVWSLSEQLKYRRNILWPGSIVSSDLVLYLDAANSESYPGSGTTWTDLSGNGNDGTLQGGVGYSPNDGGSLTFDGSNDYVNLDFPFTQSSSAYSYTIFMGARLSATSTTRRQLWGSDNGGFDWGFGAGDNTRYTIFSGDNIHTGSTQDTNWHIFTAQWSSSFGTRLYKDNVLDISTSTISYDSSVSSTTSIGRSPGRS